MTLHPLDQRAARLRSEMLEPVFERLKELHTAKRTPVPGDWLDSHDEPGQSLSQYKRSRPLRPENGRQKIYVQLLGDLATEQARVMGAAVQYIAAYFGLQVRLLDKLPLHLVPSGARRQPLEGAAEQILTTFVLHELLVPGRPKDALALIALTAVDLFPEPSWNFVFGQASLRDGVGIWSMFRNGDPSGSPEAFRLCLRRTVATAVHELTHMLGVEHCIPYECVMNGSNHRAEADARPLYLCPVCLAKLCWNLGCEPREQINRLREAAATHGLLNEAAYFVRALHNLAGRRP